MNSAASDDWIYYYRLGSYIVDNYPSVHGCELEIENDVDVFKMIVGWVVMYELSDVLKMIGGGQIIEG